PRRHPDFGWAWITRFLVMLGNSTGTLYLLYFLQDAVGYDRLFPGHGAEEGVLILTLIYTVGVVATAVIGGVISDRLGRRKAMVTISSLVMAFAALLLGLWPTWTVSMVAAAILGGGFGVYLAVDQALITQVLPRAGDRAKDLGVINIANSAPQVLGPALAAPIVAGLGGYTGLYILTAALTVAGGVLVWRIRSVP
ncbi:MAG: MFS transporter, partial [Stackebrandtia sp.]